MTTRIKHVEILDFFETGVMKETNDCVLWIYGKHRGYGVVNLGSNEIGYVHRLALIRRVGVPSKDKPYALHLPSICHNPSCFNYRHLRWGSQQENVLDRNVDGTHNKGERNGQSKLTKDIVLKIRSDNRKYADISKDFDVAISTISAVKKRNRWGWLE